MNRLLSVSIGLSVIGASAWYYLTRNRKPEFDTQPGLVQELHLPENNVSFDFNNVLHNASDFLRGGILSIVGISKVPPEYSAMVIDAEKRYGIPAGMLGRLLYQESRFRADIISGETKSRVGATGIAQFMPATAAELGIDPLNVEQSIYGAARYLSSLHANLKDWSQAVAAYNWGIGNVKRKGMAAAPTETVNYVKAIVG